VTLNQALNRAREMLAAHKDIDNPSLEAEVLLRHVLQINRVQLYTDLYKELGPGKAAELWQLVERQLRGEPIAYITQHREFYGLEFYVDTRVLIPRPESELLVEQAVAWVDKHPVSTLADIGTGSGAIAVSLAVHLPQIKIYASDISSAALEVAAINIREHRVSAQITLIKGDLFDPLPAPVDIIIANLPYVQKGYLSSMPSAKFEPVLALDGGESGLDKIFQLCRQLEGKLRPGGCLLMEIGMGQSPSVTDLLRSLYPSADIRVLPDLAGIGRVIRMTFPG
jgi:release factor glutamine methyltransferase